MLSINRELAVRAFSKRMKKCCCCLSERSHSNSEREGAIHAKNMMKKLSHKKSSIREQSITVRENVLEVQQISWIHYSTV